VIRLAPALMAGLLLGCFDPVHTDDVDALGPEAAGVPEGPLHRPGQPCTVCHGGDGPGSPTFDLAGTVFELKDQRLPAFGANVLLIDSLGSTQAVGTNEAGNFWIPESELLLGFPIWASVQFDGVTIEMKTPINRARSCGECHADPPAPSAVGHVYARNPTP
jgi:hypothetical protein